MTVQECYEQIGGDYNEIISRLRTEERIKKFAGMFLKEQSYNTLVQTLQDRNQEEAFRAAHTLKGVCQNMSFTALFKSSFDITEALRANDMEEADRLLPKVTEDYQRTLEGVKALLG